MQARCYGCMKIKNQHPICEHCGFHEQTQNQPHQLPLGAVLRDQYLVGRVLGQGGFGITYTALDRQMNKDVVIKEYFPQHLIAGREKNTFIQAESDFFRAFIREIVEFFRTGETCVKPKQTLAIMAVREAGQKAAGCPGQWVDVEAV